MVYPIIHTENKIFFRYLHYLIRFTAVYIIFHFFIVFVYDNQWFKNWTDKRTNEATGSRFNWSDRLNIWSQPSGRSDLVFRPGQAPFCGQTGRITCPVRFLKHASKHNLRPQKNRPLLPFFVVHKIKRIIKMVSFTITLHIILYVNRTIH